MLAARQVVVDRTLAGEGSVSVGIGEEHPAVGGADDDHGQGVANGAVAIEVRGRWPAERDLGDGAGVVGAGGAQRHDAAEPAEPPAGYLHRVADGRHLHERHRALAREVAEVEDLGLPG